MSLIEAAHAGDGDWQAWCDGLLDGAQRLFTSPFANLGIGRRGEAHYEILASASPLEQVRAYAAQFVPTMDARLLDPFWRFPHYVGTSADIHRSSAMDPHLIEFHVLAGSEDILGLVAMADEYSISIGAPHAERISISRDDRRLLTQVALHLEAGLRLRVQPSATIAWLETNGRVAHAEGELQSAEAREGLTSHVKLVERNRTRRLRQQPAALDAWQALIAGRWALVERGERGGGRRYAVVETSRSSHLRALTRLEAHAAEISARGLTGKLSAYALGVSTGTVSRALANAALKLGTRNRTELTRLVASLLNAGPQRHGDVALTPSEREVLSLVRLGWTNAAIARSRERSERTVANQVASLLEKLRVPSRRALAAANVDG